MEDVSTGEVEIVKLLITASVLVNYEFGGPSHSSSFHLGATNGGSRWGHQFYSFCGPVHAYGLSECQDHPYP